MMLLGIVSFLVVGCNKYTTDTAEHVTIDPNLSMKTSSFIEKQNEIILETTDSCLISTIHAIRCDDKHIALLCSDKIHVFTNDGKFKKQVGRIGRAREEYLSVCDFQLADNKILILSGYQKKIVEYNIDGTYLKTHHLNDTYFKFRMLDSDKIVLASQNSNDTHADFVWYDLSTDKVIGTSGQFKNNEGFVFPEFDSFKGTDAAEHVSYPFDYSIYSLKGPNEELEKNITFEFTTDESLPANKEEMNFMMIHECTMNKSVVRFIEDYIEIGDVRYLIYPLFGSSGIKTHITRIDSDGKNSTYKIGANIDDEFPYLCLGDYHGLYKGNVLMVGYTDTMLEFEEKNKLTHFTELGLKNGANPVLFMYKLKP